MKTKQLLTIAALGSRCGVLARPTRIALNQGTVLPQDRELSVDGGLDGHDPVLERTIESLCMDRMNECRLILDLITPPIPPTIPRRPASKLKGSPDVEFDAAHPPQEPKSETLDLPGSLPVSGPALKPSKPSPFFPSQATTPLHVDEAEVEESEELAEFDSTPSGPTTSPSVLLPPASERDSGSRKKSVVDPDQGASPPSIRHQGSEGTRRRLLIPTSPNIIANPPPKAGSSPSEPPENEGSVLGFNFDPSMFDRDKLVRPLAGSDQRAPTVLGEVCNQFSCSSELLDPQSTVDDQANTVPSDLGALPAPIPEPLGPLATGPAEAVS